MRKIRVSGMGVEMGTSPLESLRSTHQGFVGDFPEDSDFVEELKKVFEHFDIDGDGRISHTELGTVLRSLGDHCTDAELKVLVNEVDADGDGYIDLQEFIDLNRMPSRGLGDDGDCDGEQDCALLSAFNVFDVDKNGFISADELHRVLVGLGDKNVSMEDCQHMIDCVDRNGDKMVDFREFGSLMNGPCVS